MTRKELIQTVVDNTGYQKKDVKIVFENIMDTIKAALQKTGYVNISHFGIFRIKDRAARWARNPQTGEKIKVKASRKVAFRASKSFKDTL